MRVLLFTRGYSKAFREAVGENRIGWGCGYILIPLGHKFLRVSKDESQNYDDDFNWGYLQIPNFSQEITLDEIKEVNGKKYRILGFDTAHSYNNDSHDYEWVLSQALEMQRIVKEV